MRTTLGSPLEKLHDAIHLGSTSILLINIEKCVKMSQTWPFWPWQWPLEWFNQILLFTVCCHHPGEASCQNRGEITYRFWINGQVSKLANLDLSDLEKWPLERFNQIQIWVVHQYHPWEGSCQNREKVTDQFLRKCSKVQKGHNFDHLTFKKEPL